MAPDGGDCSSVLRLFVLAFAVSITQAWAKSCCFNSFRHKPTHHTSGRDIMVTVTGVAMHDSCTMLKRDVDMMRTFLVFVNPWDSSHADKARVSIFSCSAGWATIVRGPPSAGSRFPPCNIVVESIPVSGKNPQRLSFLSSSISSIITAGGGTGARRASAPPFLAADTPLPQPNRLLLFHNSTLPKRRSPIIQPSTNSPHHHHSRANPQTPSHPPSPAAILGRRCHAWASGKPEAGHICQPR